MLILGLKKKISLEIFFIKHIIIIYMNLLKKKKINEEILLVSIHSFTRRFDKIQRGIEIGLLWNKNMNLLIPIQKKLNDQYILYGRNYPYSGFHFNYTLDRHSNNGEIDNICIEFRNDLICSEKTIKKYIQIFSEIFLGLLK